MRKFSSIFLPVALICLALLLWGCAGGEEEESPPPGPSIAVTSPNGGEVWATDSVQEISWTSYEIVGDVQILLSRDGGNNWTETIAAAASNDGRFDWTCTHPSSSSCRVRTVSVTNPSVFDESDDNFTITQPGPSIAVTSPNGGEVWAANSVQEISWTSYEIVGDVQILLSRDGGNNWPDTIAAAITNDRSFDWTCTGPPGSSCRVRVLSVTSPSVFDESDDNFTITPPASIELTSPNGSEVWAENRVQEISWMSYEIVGDVQILLSRDGGNNWLETIAAATTNDGSFQWICTGPQGSSCRVRVASITSPSVFDESDDNFRITQPIGWSALNSGTTTNLYGVSFADANTGWAVGADGSILHTTNGGDTWTAQASWTTNYLTAVAFVDENHGWAVGSVGTIIHTTNGGDTWTAQNSGTTTILFCVAFVDANNGWVVGSDGTILRTWNGGHNWTDQSSGTDSDLRGVAFVDTNNGCVVGSYGAILRTWNGGHNWTEQSSGTYTWLYGVAFVDANNGWAVGWGGTILHTTDGGDTWTAQASGTTNYLIAVAFVDENHGWAVGSVGTIIHTTDGGGTWTEQSSGTENDLRGVAFVDANNGWAVGSGGTILRYFSQ